MRLSIVEIFLAVMLTFLCRRYFVPRGIPKIDRRQREMYRRDGGDEEVAVARVESFAARRARDSPGADGGLETAGRVQDFALRRDACAYQLSRFSWPSC